MKAKQTDLFGDGHLDPSLLEHLDHLPDEHNAWPTILLELHGVLQQRLSKRGIDIPELALECVLDIGEYMGGMQVYLPRGDRLRQQIRDMNIWHEFNGTNTKILARRYDVTEKTIYEVCARMRRMEQTRRQPDLFG
ncbi:MULTISPECIES: Mor transcription activator family protein [Grimontia]|uniref:Mor transcription activator family protein n=1 Tax=Grimontia TaxID=246861 RepID=UPI0013038578|nr:MULTISPECIES: Mor transcription activator family protein [Grimontia]MDF2186166.1 Mor transcription activator family protein [Grimontia hollisae]